MRRFIVKAVYGTKIRNHPTEAWYSTRFGVARLSGGEVDIFEQTPERALFLTSSFEKKIHHGGPDAFMIHHPNLTKFRDRFVIQTNNAKILFDKHEGRLIFEDNIFDVGVEP